ncbi:MAG: glycosyltransferase family 2 protein [Paludibacteraceae bacterium]|nr:glycosyltransferase family 2 protein [Paludibacteraceae bacterium]
MKLQILIPQYKEDETVIRPLLDSIALQQGVDLNEVGVIICNDGSDTLLNLEWLISYPYQVLYIRHDHGGLSRTRNECLDYATAEYVMFCDADDMFYDLCALHRVFMELNGCDALASAFIEEVRIGGKSVYVTHKRDGTFVHGKIYRRQFLLDNELRFCDRLTVHEDGYFNQLACLTAEDLRYIESPFYVWRWNPNSITRSSPTWMMETYCDMIDGNDALVDELQRRGLDPTNYVKWMLEDAEKNHDKLTDEAKARMEEYETKHKEVIHEIPR